MYRIGCMVDAGKNEKNDDRVLVGSHIVREGYYETKLDHLVAMICDGVGGEMCGDEAAEIIVDYFANLDQQNMSRSSINRDIFKTDFLIQRAQGKDVEHRRMASTLAGIYMKEDQMEIFNIGDSRVYRYRKPFIAQMTKDHSLSQEIKSLGLTPKPNQEHVITQYMGGACNMPFFYNGNNQILDADTFLLCSDGISDMLSDIEIEEILKKESPLEKTCRELIESANARGATDNMSVIIIEKEEE